MQFCQNSKCNLRNNSGSAAKLFWSTDECLVLPCIWVWSKMMPPCSIKIGRGSTRFQHPRVVKLKAFKVV